MEIKNSKSTEDDINGLLIFANFILFIFFNSISIYLIVSNPCYIKPYKMTTECVACWEESTDFGIKCHYCNNVAMCTNCYIKWKEKGNTCPLCRAYYIV